MYLFLKSVNQTGKKSRYNSNQTFLVFSLIASLLFSPILTAHCTFFRDDYILITKPDSQYSDNGDGTISDLSTGLMWQKCSAGLTGNTCTSGAPEVFTWQAALAFANDNTSFGYSDWRLPNPKELASLAEGACNGPAINETLFPNTESDFYWSSSPFASDTGESLAWASNFDYGTVEFVSKNNKYYVRLVRNY